MTMDLPLDYELNTPESILQWIEELGVTLQIHTLNRYPDRPILLSSYRYEPPMIHIYRYEPLEEWLNLMSQRRIGYYGPWYFIHIGYRLYYHLELNGIYSIEPKWYHRLFGELNTIDKRAWIFTKEILGTLHDPERFDKEVEKAFQPGIKNSS